MPTRNLLLISVIFASNVQYSSADDVAASVLANTHTNLLVADSLGEVPQDEAMRVIVLGGKLLFR